MGFGCKKFNDPFECDFNLKEFEAYCNEDIIKTSKNFADNVNELRKHIALMRNSTVVSCLSEKHDLILMWSHYANKHQGICMCYGVADLLNTRKILVPVWYRNEKINPFEKTNDGTLGLNKRIKEIFIQKASEWGYEEEWRLIELVEESNCDRFKALEKDKGLEIKVVYPERIILGAKVTDELKKEVLRIAKEHSITVTQMKMCDDEFKLIEMNIDV